MSAATVAQFRAYFKQLPADPILDDDEIQDVLDRAESIIYGELDGIVFDPYSETAAAPKIVHGYPGEYLILPPHQAGTVAGVLDQWGNPITGWLETEEGNLWSGNSSGLNFRWGGGRYSVTAKWGAGEPPDSFIELELEVAGNLWREKDRGVWSDAIGVEASGEVRVGYQGGLTNRQKMIIEALKRKYGPPIVV